MRFRIRVRNNLRKIEQFTRDHPTKMYQSHVINYHNNRISSGTFLPTSAERFLSHAGVRSDDEKKRGRRLWGWE